MATQTAALGKAALLKAIDHFGGQAQLAREITSRSDRTVSQQWIWNVVNRSQPIPPEWCLPIELATGGKIRRHQLRPDLYPEKAVRVAS